MNNDHTLFRRNIAERYARCLYGELERGCKQTLTFHAPLSVAGVTFTGIEEQSRLQASVTSKLEGLLTQIRHPRFTLIGVTVLLLDDNLRIDAQIKCL